MTDVDRNLARRGDGCSQRLGRGVRPRQWVRRCRAGGIRTLCGNAVAPERPAIIADRHADRPTGASRRRRARWRRTRCGPLLGARKSRCISMPSRPAVERASFRADDDAGVACWRNRPSNVRCAKYRNRLFIYWIRSARWMRCLRSTRSRYPPSMRCIRKSRFGGSTASAPLGEPKKVKSRSLPAWTAPASQAIASGRSSARDLINAPPPKGAAADDALDALACVAVARRLHAGLATSFPEHFAA